jgi:hypothetical protein
MDGFTKSLQAMSATARLLSGFVAAFNVQDN